MLIQQTMLKNVKKTEIEPKIDIEKCNIKVNVYKKFN